MNLAELPVSINEAQIARFCRARDIRKLSLFGSVLRSDFDSSRSDVDVLAEYVPGRTPGYDFIEHEEQLSKLLNQRVDLNTPRSLGGRFREKVMEDAFVLYEQA